jgi:hypothetical protein
LRALLLAAVFPLESIARQKDEVLLEWKKHGYLIVETSSEQLNVLESLYKGN